MTLFLNFSNLKNKIFMKIYVINLKNIENLNKFLDKLHNIGYKEQYLNDISFCPYLIIHKNFDSTKTDFIYENINEGYLKMLTNNFNVIQIDNVDDFISYSISVQSENENSLF